MKYVNYIMLTIAIIGALNWGSIGLFDANLVTMLFGVDTMLTRIVYALVGVSGLWLFTFYSKVKDSQF